MFPSAKGWRWQGIWSWPATFEGRGAAEPDTVRIPTYNDYLYAIVIDELVVNDNWIPELERP